MPELVHEQLAAWGNFYVIIGSAGAALIGIQFVVVTLIADMPSRTDPEAIGAFGTPTVVHFASTLFVAAAMSAPWRSFAPLALVLAVCGFGGLVYGGVIARRARRQTNYQPVLSDWIWFVVVPTASYATLALSALFLRAAHVDDLFVVAAAALVLLLVGIRNAWDSVTHLVVSRAASAHEG